MRLINGQVLKDDGSIASNTQVTFNLVNSNNQIVSQITTNSRNMNYSSVTAITDANGMINVSLVPNSELFGTQSYYIVVIEGQTPFRKILEAGGTLDFADFKAGSTNVSFSTTIPKHIEPDNDIGIRYQPFPVDKYINFIEYMRHYRAETNNNIRINNIGKTPVISCNISGLTGRAEETPLIILNNYNPISWNSNKNGVVGATINSDYYNTLPKNGVKKDTNELTNSFCGVLNCTVDSSVSYVKAYIKTDAEYVHSIAWTGQSINKDDTYNYDNKVYPDSNGKLSLLITGFYGGTVVIHAYDSSDTLMSLSFFENVTSHFFANLRAELYVVTDSWYLIESAKIQTNGLVKFSSTTNEKVVVKIVDGATLLTALSTKLNLVSSYKVDSGDTNFQYIGNGSFLYDQALAILAYVAYNPIHSSIKELVGGLISVQEADGSFRFKEDLLVRNSDPYYRTGAVAWCVYALAKAYYANNGLGQTTKDSIAKGGDYLLSLIVTEDGYQKGAVRGGKGQYSADYSTFDPDYIIPWCSTEHNIDTYFALNWVYKVTGTQKYLDGANGIKNALMTNFFDYTKGHFRQGISSQTEYDNNCALDCLSWGALFLTDIGEMNKAIYALKVADDVYFNTVNGYSGYKAYADEHGYTGAVDTVWAEGSFGVACASMRVGDFSKWFKVCKDIVAISNANGEIPYVTVPVPEYEMQNYPATISASWSVISTLAPNLIFKR